MRLVGPIRANPLDRQIGDRISRLLAARGLNHATVAVRMNLSVTELDARIQGLVRFNAQQLYDLSRVLDVKVAAFYVD